MKKSVISGLVMGLVLVGQPGAAFAQFAFPDTYKDDTTREIGFGVNLPPIDTTRRDQVVRAHRYYGWGFRYETSPEMEAKRADSFGLWDTTAVTSSCTPGATRQEIRHGFVREVNFLRALAGTPQIKTETNPEMIGIAQEGALALAANSDVRAFGGHILPSDSKCFTQKALSGVTNGQNFGTSHTITYLARGYSLSSVLAFMGDAGAGNFWVGHRQAMLEPSTSAIGLSLARNPVTSGIGQNHTIQTGGDRSKSWYAYPSPGYFPYRYVPGVSNRWSFSCKDCDFAGATVEMKLNGQSLPPPVYESDFLVPAFYRTFVWRPTNVPSYRSGNNGLTGPAGDQLDTNAQFVSSANDDVYEVTVRNYRQFNTATGTIDTKTTSYTVITMDPAKHQGAVVPAYDFTDLWWDPNENGHGVQITQSIQYDSALLFGLWYRYDSTGTGRWVQLSGGTWSDPWTFTGQVYRPRGTPALNYSAAGFQPEVIGTFTMRFNSRDTMTLTYNTASEGTIVKNLKRFREGLPKDFTDGKNYTGIYWNPQENGWGLALTHYYQILFGGWYTYDAAGETRWIILPGATWVSPTEARGALFRGSGPVSMTNYQAGQYQASQVGEATLTFLPDGKIRFAYTLDGVSQVKTIEPLGY